MRPTVCVVALCFIRLLYRGKPATIVIISSDIYVYVDAVQSTSVRSCQGLLAC